MGKQLVRPAKQAAFGVIELHFWGLVFFFWVLKCHTSPRGHRKQSISSFMMRLLMLGLGPKKECSQVTLLLQFLLSDAQGQSLTSQVLAPPPITHSRCQVLLLHAGAVWYYQAFLRDHLMARHVTRITLERRRWEFMDDSETAPVR